MSWSRVSFVDECELDGYEATVRSNKWMPYVQAAEMITRKKWVRIDFDALDYERARTGLYKAARLRGWALELKHAGNTIFMRIAGQRSQSATKERT